MYIDNEFPGIEEIKEVRIDRAEPGSQKVCVLRNASRLNAQALEVQEILMLLNIILKIM